MHKIKIGISPKTANNSELTKLLTKYFESNVVSALFKHGGQINISIALKQTIKKKRKSKSIITQADIDSLTTEKNPEIMLDKLKTLNKEALISMCLLLKLPISKKAKVTTIRDVIFDYLRFPDKWKQISG